MKDLGCITDIYLSIRMEVLQFVGVHVLGQAENIQETMLCVL